jgi:hypothetical protein
LFLKKYLSYGFFQKKCVFAESALFNIFFRVLLGFSSLKGLK